VNATLILAIIAALAIWVGSLYLSPFGHCGTCKGAGHVKHGRRVKVCPRCKGRRRVQRAGSRTVHRLAFKIRDGQRAAAKYQEDSDGDS
jgi:DnaJ-class molecular chaperone